MKASIITLAVVAGLASAQFSGVPQCAQGCLTTAISSVGCPISDVGCQCSSTAAIQSYGAGCIISACTGAGELNSALSGGLALCSSYLATVSASTTPTSAPAETTEATDTSTVTAETTSVPAPTTAGTNTTTPTGTGGINPPSSTSTPSPSQVPVGGAPNLVAGIGGFVGLAIAFFAVAL